MSEVRLEVKNLCKSFGITKAVQNVSFNVNKGEVHALIGENGSGKSTLTNMLTGIYSIGSGTFVLDGKEIHPKNQVEANNEGVSIIVQELGTLSGLTVAENIFLGCTVSNPCRGVAFCTRASCASKVMMFSTPILTSS